MDQAGGTDRTDPGELIPLRDPRVARSGPLDATGVRSRRRKNSCLMIPGIFAKTFSRPTFEETLDAVARHGFECIQFNFSICGLPSLPDSIASELSAQIRHACAQRGLHIAAVSGTFNMIHPDPKQRLAGLRRLEVLAAACAILGAPIVTLCTGTRDPDNLWRAHPANRSAGAWLDLLDSIGAALRIAERHHIVLAIEPEVSNVIDRASQARRLLDEFSSPHLKVVIDAANLFHHGGLARQDDILRSSIELLAPDIVLAHAKDLLHDGEAGDRAAGTGVLNFPLYLSLLHQAGYAGPLILHGLSEEQADTSRNFLQRQLRALHNRP